MPSPTPAFPDAQLLMRHYRAGTRAAYDHPLDGRETLSHPHDRMERWAQLAAQLRVDSVRITAAAGSGHPSSALSAADLMAVLLDAHLRYDFAEPEDPRNDRLVFSKGHAASLLYAMLRAVGAIDEEELLTFRLLGSRLQGDPTPALPWVDVATGAPGFGLAAGVGIALAGRRLDQLPYRVWVLCGDGEMAEGAAWEAIEHAGHERLDNLVLVLDANRLGRRGQTMLGSDVDRQATRLHAFGWQTHVIDGHDLAEIDNAYRAVGSLAGHPLAIIARTVKGRGVSAIADRDGLHGLPLPDPQAAVDELGGRRDIRVRVRVPSGSAETHRFSSAFGDWPSWSPGESVATAHAYGEALVALGSRDGRVVALDADAGEATGAARFFHRHPGRHFEIYSSEQQLVAAATGIQARGWVPFASTYAARIGRAQDFLRMASIGGAHVCVVGAHAGVSIGAAGPSRMGLADIATLRAVPDSTVLYPCCANQTVSLVSVMAQHSGIVYLRTTRLPTPVLYVPGEDFPVGGSRTVRAVDGHADVTVLGAGVTVVEALAAAEDLAAEGLEVRVIDLYSVKPVDAAALAEAASCSDALLVAEDHCAQGGLADAVREALDEISPRPPIRSLAVRTLPTSGRPAELLRQAGIDRTGIAAAIRALATAGARV